MKAREAMTDNISFLRSYFEKKPGSHAAGFDYCEVLQRPYHAFDLLLLVLGEEEPVKGEVATEPDFWLAQFAVAPFSDSEFEVKAQSGNSQIKVRVEPFSHHEWRVTIQAETWEDLLAVYSRMVSLVMESANTIVVP